MLKFANIIVDISHEKLDKVFQYIIPKHLQNFLFAGVRVDIPFGKANRLISGYVVEVTDTAEYDVTKLKCISGITKGSIPIESQLIALASWMKQHTGCTLNQALKTVIPIKREIKGNDKISISLAISKNEADRLKNTYASRKNTVKRAEIIQYLLKNKEIDKEKAKAELEISDAIIKGMEKSGILKLSASRIYRNPFVIDKAVESGKKVTLNEEQQQVTNEIISAIADGEERPHLIYGVTGSGKTEVYMELIEYMLQRKQQIIVLIPEISLTYQTVMRFYSRFGSRVSVINSKLSQGEKYDQFERAKNGDVDIMIGPRSALFTPFNNLGLIIIDEEQENAYKSESVPRYHAVETAIARARLASAAVVLGSATPSVTSFYRASTDRYVLHKLNNRAMGASMAHTKVIDMREELKSGNKSMFSTELDRLIQNRLENNQQIMLFINRRGYANFVSCRACGKAIKCPHCDVSLKYHNDGKLRCHYCGYEEQSPKVCPQCGSKFIAPFGTGTQKVEAAVRERYPTAKVLRMDMDTTTGKNGHNEIIEKFAKHEADILIGTQMIVKGHDFPMVTLVGIIAADLSLYASTYTASESTFQLLTQAAGRAGRGTISGNVIIQTYNPEEYSIIAAANQDYMEFYNHEIAYRKLMQYPPSSGMLTIQTSSENEELAEKCAKMLYNDAVAFDKELIIIGPAKASIYKINDIYRNMLYIKGNEKLINLQKIFEDDIKNHEEMKAVNVQYDFENI